MTDNRCLTSSRAPCFTGRGDSQLSGDSPAGRSPPTRTAPKQARKRRNIIPPAPD